MTIWQATQQLDIDNLKTPTGKIISVMDMITEGDDFLQTECTIEDGYIYIGSMRYSDADAPKPTNTTIMNYPNQIIGSLYCETVLDKPCTLNLVDGVYYSDQFQINANDLDFTEFDSRAIIRGFFSNIGEFAIMPQFPNKTF